MNSRRFKGSFGFDFGATLFLSALLRAPWQTIFPRTILWSLTGFAARQSSAGRQTVILEVDEIKTTLCTPPSHPFVERLIGTVRRECLDRTLFWNGGDLGRKLDNYPSLIQPTPLSHRAGRSYASATE
jgi:hypothetical protein